MLETLVAMVVLGLGVLMYMRMQSRASGLARSNADLFRAGRIIEKHVETMRVRIARNAAGSWPPKDTAFYDPVHRHISLVSRVEAATSPKDGANLPGVRKVGVTVAWGKGPLDTIRVTTYVSKSF